MKESLPERRSTRRTFTSRINSKLFSNSKGHSKTFTKNKLLSLNLNPSSTKLTGKKVKKEFKFSKKANKTNQSLHEEYEDHFSKPK